MSALVTSSDWPVKARPHGESKSGLEMRRTSLPDGSSAAIWLVPIKPTYRLPDFANAMPEACGNSWPGTTGNRCKLQVRRRQVGAQRQPIDGRLVVSPD